MLNVQYPQMQQREKFILGFLFGFKRVAILGTFTLKNSPKVGSTIQKWSQGVCGKLRNRSKISPGGLWKHDNIFSHILTPPSGALRGYLPMSMQKQ